MTLNIGKMFHIVHISEVLGPLDAWYDDVFAPKRGIMDNNYLPARCGTGRYWPSATRSSRRWPPPAGPGPRSCRWGSSSTGSAGTSIRWRGTPMTWERSGSGWSTRESA